jgi:ABC-2 type transport system ATP-binding protein
LGTECPDTSPVFDVVSVTKAYRGHSPPANDHVTLSISRGEVFGILGDNGAGKTTLVQQMAGLVAPTDGEIRFLGDNVAAAERQLTTKVGYMPQTAFALNSLTASEAIFFTARFRGLSRRTARDEVGRLLSAWGIESLRHRIAKQMSGGQRRLLQLAVTMTASPPVLILDEPTNNLDPVNRRRVWQLLSEANRAGATIIFVTHDAIEAEKIVHRVAIMQRGTILAIGRPADLKRDLSNQFRLELTGIRERPAALPAWVQCSEVEPGRWVAVLGRSDVGDILSSLDANQFDDIRLGSATLEDLYLHYVVKP